MTWHKRECIIWRVIFCLVMLAVINVLAQAFTPQLFNPGMESVGIGGSWDASNWIQASGNVCVLPPCLAFDGTNDYLSRASTNLGLDNVTTMTVECWVYHTAAGTYTVFDKQHSGWATFSLSIEVDKFIFTVQNVTGSAFPTWQTNATLSQNQWNHIAGVWNRTSGGSGDVVLYLNGAVAAHTFTANGYTSSFVADEAAGTLYVGVRADLAQYLSGRVDECAVWNTNLSGTTIAAHYNVGLGAPVVGNESNLIWCSHFDEGTGTTTNDCQGTDHLTLQNMASPATATSGWQIRLWERQGTNCDVGSFCLKSTGDSMRSYKITAAEFPTVTASVRVRAAGATNEDATLRIVNESDTLISGCTASDTTLNAAYETITVSNCALGSATYFKLQLLWVTGTLYWDTATITFSNSATAGQVGTSSDSTPFGAPPHNNIWFTGLHHEVSWHQNTAGGIPNIAYGRDDDLKFGTPHSIPSAASISSGSNMDTYLTFRGFPMRLLTATVDSANDLNISIIVKGNDSKSSSAAWDTSSVVGTFKWPSAIFGWDDYTWVSYTQGTGGSERIDVQRSTDTYDATLGSATTIKAASADSKASQVIPLNDTGDIGICYSSAANLYYKYYTKSTTSWGSEQQINTAGLNTVGSFRCIPTRNNKVFAIYRATNDLYYKIRSAGSGGTWGSENTLATDVYNVEAYFTGTHNACTNEDVYTFYYDGTNIVYKLWNGSTLGSKTTLVSSPGTIDYFMAAPLFETLSIGVGYKLTATSNIKMANLVLPTCAQVSTDGVFVATDADTYVGTHAGTRQMHTLGDKSFVMYTGRNMMVYGRIYNHATSSWEGSWTPMLDKIYWEIGNDVTSQIDSNGIIYIGYGGEQGSGTTEYVSIRRSTVALDNAAFSLTDFVDVSPASFVTDRAYKELVIDNNGYLYLLYVDNLQQTGIKIRRGNTWGSSISLVSVQNANGKVYMNTAFLGKEASGQKSIHYFWSWQNTTINPSIEEGTIMGVEINYAKLLLQTDGTLKVYKASGTEITSMPMIETDSARYDSVYYSEPSGEWIRTGIASSGDAFDDNKPATIYIRNPRTSPYNPSNVWLSRWNGSAWEHDKITPDGTSMPFHFYPTLIIRKSGATETLFSSGQELYSSIPQITLYKSTNNGDTWSLAQQVTNATFSAWTPLQSPRTATTNNLIFHVGPHRNYSEVRFFETKMFEAKPETYPFDPFELDSRLLEGQHVSTQ